MTDGFQRDLRKEKVICVCRKGRLPCLTFPKLSACDKIDHLFTTREGGVSSGQFRSLNFSVNLGDDPKNVEENYRRVAAALNGEIRDVTGTVQTHTTNVRRVTERDRGKVAFYPADYHDVDGLVTNVKGIILAAFTADCVPIFYVDPVKEAIGLAHSGWRGTVNNMAGKMVETMRAEFGSQPEDLIVAIGPSICQKCYEVDETVADAFRKALGEAEGERRRIKDELDYSMIGRNGLRDYLEPGRETGKYQLDLWMANLIFLLRSGVLSEHVDVTDVCTAENSQLLFSHRASHGKRGNLGSFLKLK